MVNGVPTLPMSDWVIIVSAETPVDGAYPLKDKDNITMYGDDISVTTKGTTVSVTKSPLFPKTISDLGEIDWTVADIDDGKVVLLIPRSYHGKEKTTMDTAADLASDDWITDYYIRVTYDRDLKQWKSEIPQQCIDLDMCPRTKCPGRTSYGVECREEPAFPLDQDAACDTNLFYLVDGSDTTKIVGGDEASTATIEEFFNREKPINSQYYTSDMEGLPTCFAGDDSGTKKGECDNKLEEYNSVENTCTDINECDRWLAEYQTDGKNIYEEYEEIMRSGSATAWADAKAVWDKLSTDLVITDKNGIKDPLTQTGKPEDMLCKKDTAQRPSNGSFVVPKENGSQLECVNKGPREADDGFVCECPSGSEFTINKVNPADSSTWVGACTDIRECSNGTHQCGTQPCIDYCFHGKFAAWGNAQRGQDPDTCYWLYTDLSKKLTDITDNTDYPKYTGKIGGGYGCECPAGYEYDFNKKDCVDINECTHADYTKWGQANDQNICEGGNTGAICVNVPGDFYCACAAGQYKDTVFAQFGNETDGFTDPAECDNAKCTKMADGTGSDTTDGGATNTGYCFGGVCSCSNGEQCAQKCDADGDGVNDDGVVPGFDCHECKPMATCKDTDAGYECSCPINSAQDGKSACNDGNQCGPGLTGTLDCAAKGLSCKEEDVGYNCVCADDSTYKLDSTGKCVDVDECTETPGICNEGNCLNTDGGFQCKCFAGYDLVLPGRSVVGLPAKAQQSLKSSRSGGRSAVGISSDNWQVFAINQVASQSRTGERQSQFVCKDADECANAADNHCVDAAAGGTCQNLEGSYSCGCASGWSGDGADATKYNQLNGSENGWIAPLFLNSPGSPDTFLGCVDIDECLGGHNCHADATCVNLAGGFKCVCPAGKVGDGVSGCFDDPTQVPTTTEAVASTTTTAETTTTASTGIIGGINNDFNCAGQGFLGQYANIGSDVAITCFGVSCGVQCTDPSKSPNVSGLFCQNTGKAKKQGWKNGSKKLSAGTVITCGGGDVPTNPTDGPVTGAGFCNMTGDMLASKYGSHVNFSKCRAGSKKCKISCRNGGKPNPKKLKCKNGRISASSIRC